jgi:hypothetical protein
VSQPTTRELVINHLTPRMLSLTVPPTADVCLWQILLQKSVAANSIRVGGSTVYRTKRHFASKATWSGR